MSTSYAMSILSLTTPRFTFTRPDLEIQLRLYSGITTMEINILFVLCCIEHTVVQCFIHTLFSQKKQVLIEVLMGQNCL